MWENKGVAIRLGVVYAVPFSKCTSLGRRLVGHLPVPCCNQWVLNHASELKSSSRRLEDRSKWMWK